MSIAQQINMLGAYCGVRDVDALSKEALRQRYGFDQADVMTLFGGSILCGGDVLAQAMEVGVAKTYVIVGGAGHTTPTLRQVMAQAFPGLDTMELSEAALFDAYIHQKYGLRADYLEQRSTNCGNNITNLLALLEREDVAWQSMILCQDATMQRRMDATLRKHRPDAVIVNFAAYQATVLETGAGLRYAEPLPGMWDMQRYINLLMGEIPRLRDDANGYGPLGKGFIAHVDIPPQVLAAHAALSKQFCTREANPQFAG